MGARDLLDDLAAAGFGVTVTGDKLVIRPASRLTDDLRSALREAKPELLALLSASADRPRVTVTPQDRPYRLTPAAADAAHAEPWDEAACARFVARVTRLLRLGIGVADADDMAERARLLDVQGEGRTLCMDCRHLAGHATAGWRCTNHKRAGVGRDLPAALLTTPQRCPRFKGDE